MNSDNSNKSKPVKFKLKKGEENTHYYMKSHINSKHKPVVKAWLDESLKRGFIRKCPESRTVSRMLLIPKRQAGKFRIVVSMVKSNSMLIPQRSHIDSVEDILQNIEPGNSLAAAAAAAAAATS